MNLKRKRPSAPCNDRDTVYKQMDGWSFEEVNEMNVHLLQWIEKTVFIHQPTLISISHEHKVSPRKFLRLLGTKNGLWLERLAMRLGSFETRQNRQPQRSCYEVFYEFAKNDAKLAYGCIFLEEELLGNLLSHEDYKSVFYTLYKLANQARDKFGVPTLAEIQGMNWEEWKEIKCQEHREYFEREELYKIMSKWNFDKLEKKNLKIMKWLGMIEPFSRKLGINPKEFLKQLSSFEGKSSIGKLSNPAAVELIDEEFLDNFYAFTKNRLPDECIFCLNELDGDTYEDYKSVFCTLYMLMKSWEEEYKNATENATSSSAAVNLIMPRQSSTNKNATNKPAFVLYVTTLTGKKITLTDCFPAQAIRQIKAEITVKEGIPVDQQRLMKGGKELEDNYRLMDYNIETGSTIQLVLKLCGC